MYLPCLCHTLQIDVEGWEWAVVKGAEQLLKNFYVENIVMEYSPGELLLGAMRRGSVASVRPRASVLASTSRVSETRARHLK